MIPTLRIIHRPPDDCVGADLPPFYPLVVLQLLQPSEDGLLSHPQSIC